MTSSLLAFSNKQLLKQSNFRSAMMQYELLWAGATPTTESDTSENEEEDTESEEEFTED